GVIVVEVMGRSTGWLAVCAGAAGGADAVVAPEQPVTVAGVCDLIRRRIARGRLFSIVVVAEGARFDPEPDAGLRAARRHPDRIRSAAGNAHGCASRGSRRAARVRAHGEPAGRARD